MVRFVYYVLVASRTRFIIPHFYPFPSLRLLPFAGTVDKLVLPEGMQSVNFNCCKGLAGTAEGLG